MIDLSGKFFLITGASSGLGRAISQKVALQGGTLILSGRNETRLEETLDSLHGDGHFILPGNIDDFSIRSEIIRIVIEKGIKVSGFVHSAGIEKTVPFKSSDTSVFKEVFNTNVFAGFEFARLLSQRNIVNSSGASFIFISSIKSKLGSPYNAAYCASKSALLGGAKAIAIELAPRKIRCNCVLPGFVDTELIRGLFDSIPVEAKEKIMNDHPLGLGKPEDVASLVAFLLSDEARWITGAEYIIDGGYSIH